MKSRELYEELLKNERRTQLRLKCLSGAMAVMFFAAFLVTLFGLEIVRKVEKGFRFQTATCAVQDSALTDRNMSCNCGIDKSCTSHYPCLKIFVTFSAKERDVGLNSKRVLLYNNIYDIGSDVSNCFLFFVFFHTSQTESQVSSHIEDKKCIKSTAAVVQDSCW